MSHVLESLTTQLWKPLFLRKLIKISWASRAASYENGTKPKQAITLLFLRESRNYCEQIKQIHMLGSLRYLLTNVSLFVPLLHSGYTQTSYGWWWLGWCSQGKLPKAPVANKGYWFSCGCNKKSPARVMARWLEGNTAQSWYLWLTGTVKTIMNIRIITQEDILNVKHIFSSKNLYKVPVLKIEMTTKSRDRMKVYV
jgi:hypothetical protein